MLRSSSTSAIVLVTWLPPPLLRATLRFQYGRFAAELKRKRIGPLSRLRRRHLGISPPVVAISRHSRESASPQVPSGCCHEGARPTTSPIRVRFPDGFARSRGGEDERNARSEERR